MRPVRLPMEGTRRRESAGRPLRGIEQSRAMLRPIWMRGRRRMSVRRGCRTGRMRRMPTPLLARQSLARKMRIWPALCQRQRRVRAVQAVQHRRSRSRARRMLARPGPHRTGRERKGWPRRKRGRTAAFAMRLRRVRPEWKRARAILHGGPQRLTWQTEVRGRFVPHPLGLRSAGVRMGPVGHLPGQRSRMRPAGRPRCPVPNPIRRRGWPTGTRERPVPQPPGRSWKRRPTEWRERSPPRPSGQRSMRRPFQRPLWQKWEMRPTEMGEQSGWHPPGQGPMRRPAWKRRGAVRCPSCPSGVRRPRVGRRAELRSSWVKPDLPKGWGAGFPRERPQGALTRLSAGRFSQGRGGA